MREASYHIDDTALELLYNHKHICEIVLLGDKESAQSCLRSQAEFILNNNQYDETAKLELRFIFLTSLNRSLYAFILYSLDVSLTKCCYENRKRLDMSMDTAAFLSAADAIIESYLANINVSSSAARYIEKACQYIKQHKDEELTLEKVAAQVYISKCRLCQMFKPITGRTFLEYVTHERVAHACNLLLTTSDSITHIAMSCGFRTAAYFSTVFKHEVGVTAKEFRGRLASAR